jgi:hypothetical protein
MNVAVSAAAGSEDRRLDVICLGRLGVDLYAQRVGARLEDASSLARYLGGSSDNIAFGCARLGLRAALAPRAARVWPTGRIDDGGPVSRVVTNFAALVLAWRGARRARMEIACELPGE